MSSLQASNAATPVGADVLCLGRVNGWLRRAGETRLHALETKEHYGVSVFADEVTFVPGVTRTKEEILALAEELYGPAWDIRPRDPSLCWAVDGYACACDNDTQVHER